MGATVQLKCNCGNEVFEFLINDDDSLTINCEVCKAEFVALLNGKLTVDLEPEAQ